MKNLTSLIVVLCLLVVLGCKCQSDMFDSTKNTASPTPSASASTKPSASASPTSTPKERSSDASSSDNSKLATGSYTGSGKNVTFNKTGDILLRIDSVESNGDVEGYFEASNGLTGSADVKGKIESNGKMNLSGTLDDGRSFAISATVSGETISAGYGIADSKLKTESGNFTVRRR